MGRNFENAAQTSTQYRGGVLARDDDADSGMMFPSKWARPQSMGQRKTFRLGRKVQTREMSVDRLLLEQRDLGLCFRILRNAPRRFPPVIKNLRDMADRRRLFAQPEHELEVLDAVERGIEPGLQRQLTADTQQVADIHGAPEIFRRPFRLEERSPQPAGRFVQLVLV